LPWVTPGLALNAAIEPKKRLTDKDAGISIALALSHAGNYSWIYSNTPMKR
jgi:hypothetical protein